MVKRLLVTLSLLFSVAIFSQKQDVPGTFKTGIAKLLQSHSKEANFRKAYSFYTQANWDSTLVYAMRQIRSETGNAMISEYCHYFRGISFKNKKLLDEAKHELGKVSQKVTFRHAVDLTLGQIALEQGHFENALAYFARVETRLDQADGFNRGAFYHNIGVCHFHLGQFDEAEKYLFRATGLQEKQADTSMLVTSYMDIANLYYEQFEDAKAIPYFEKAYRLSKKVYNYELRQNAALNMAVVQENRKKLQSALVYRKEYENWKDSLNDQNKIWAIAEIEKKHIVQQKQKEITLIRAKSETRKAQRNGLFYSSSLLLALLGTGVYFYRQKVKRNKIILIQKQTLDQLNATKDQLFSIVSHDLRSSVNALKTSNEKLQHNLKAKNYDALDTQLHQNSKIANGTYNLLDNLLHWAMLQTKQAYFLQEKQHLFSVAEQVVYNYKAIMADKGIHFENSIPESAYVSADLDSLKIILRNLLDNAIKFSGANGSILVYTRASEDNFCNLVVEDSGAGMPPETIEALLQKEGLHAKKAGNEMAGTGLGMQLCRSLVQKIGGRLHIESQLNAGTKMIVSLPKMPNNG
jgi:signal transduction histidine kinase